ncbi:MAG: calcineurin [bacterium]|nr:calcineurin [bacterium]
MKQHRLLLSLLLITLCVLSCAERYPTRINHHAPRIVAIGDLHGDLDATRRALRLAGAINERDQWIGEETIIVQTGDQLDRGDDEQAILDLLEQLHGEAVLTGGAVYVLNGNHELMNAALDLRYITPGGFVDFEDAVTYDPADPTLGEYPVEQRARVAAFRPGGKYARLLAQRNVVLIVGDNLFVHGGILPSHIDYGLERINAETRSWLLGETERPECIRGARSPIWSRLYSDEPTSASCDTLNMVLEALSVKRMVVGHTVQEEGITSYFDAAVWCIDSGMAEHYGGSVEVLEIMGDDVRVLREPAR